MRCPPGSYDVNVEPAKDDVLFTNSTLVLEQVEAIFKEVYGEAKAVDSATGPSKKSISRSDHAFDLLLARKPSTPEQSPVLNNRREHDVDSNRVHRSDIAGFRDSQSPSTVQGTPIDRIPRGQADFTKSINSSLPHENANETTTSTWKANMYTGMCVLI